MKSFFRIATPALVLLFAFAEIPATAQYANEYVPARLLHQGTTTSPIAGSGKVIVQVEVHPDGSHKAIKVIKSTNSGDNAAAMDIAQNSTYRPAHRGSTPITAFYDFTLQFNGKSVATTSEGGSGPGSSGGSMSSTAASIAALIRSKHYAEAKSKAAEALLSSPGDDSLRQMLGIAAYDTSDFTTAAAAFDKVGTIGSQFKPIAVDSLATAAVESAHQNASQALAYAQKAMSIQPTTISRFALGVAQLANNQNADALASLKAAADSAKRDPKIPTSLKVKIDSELLQAYLANNDTQGAQAVATEIRQLDPKSNAGAVAMGSSLIKAGQAAVDSKDVEGAVKDFDQAAALGDPEVSVTAYTSAAFAVARAAKPDYKRMQAYADKALALKPNDAQANFAEGIALTGQWASSHDDGTKKKAADALSRADQQAKAEGNEALALQIESFVKRNLNAAPAAGSGGGA